MNSQMILEQSKAAYAQWCEQWRAQAKEHASFEMKSIKDFENIGIGRVVLSVANGYSLEENLEQIKQHRDNIDILCCDKSLGSLIDHGIFPDFCMVCDANVNYEKYMKQYEDKLDKTILFINVCANPEWSKNGNWKDKYFFINKDILESEKEFSKLSGCSNFIAAGTNVSNAMIVLLTQCDNNGGRNFFGYDKICLIGYDYSWKASGKYYAFNETGDGKANYMRHHVGINRGAEPCFTSGNLLFSAQWLDQYVKAFRLPVVQCSTNTILGIPFMSDLGQLTYRHKAEDSVIVRESVKELRQIIERKKHIEEQIGAIAKDHWNAHIASL